MEHTSAYPWGFAIVGVPIVLGLIRYYGTEHSDRRTDMMREDPCGHSGQGSGRPSFGHW